MSTKANFTGEQVKEIILKWAEEKAKQGEIVFDPAFCKGYVRYKTTRLTKWIPDNSKECSGWSGRREHYAYEIECRPTILNLLLSFSYTNISDKTKRTCDELLRKFKKMHKLDNADSDDNYYRLCVFDIKIKDCQTEEDIRKAMDILFYRMKGYEEFIIFKLKEAAKA